MSNWMSLRAYARHRGDALSAVQKAIANNRVSADAVKRDANGRLTGIDQERADREWALNTDPAEALKNGKNPSALLTSSPVALNTSPAEASAEDPAADDEAGASVGAGASPGASSAADRGYLDARTLEKQFQAKKAELDYLERVGQLVSADEAREETFSIFRQHRDKLEQIPVSLSEKLAAETDPQRVEHVLRTAIRATLNELSRALAVDAAGGIAERAAVTA